SEAMMLVTDEVDNNQQTWSNHAPGGGGNVASGAQNHRLRRAFQWDSPRRSDLDNVVRVDYTVNCLDGASIRMQKVTPIFKREPDERRRLPLQIFVLWDPAPAGGGAAAPVILLNPADPNTQVWDRDIRIIRETYTRLGIATRIVNHGSPSAGPGDTDFRAGDGFDFVRVVDSRTVNDANGNPIQPSNILNPERDELSSRFTALSSDTIRLFYVRTLDPGFEGIGFNDSLFGAQPPPRVGTSWVISNAGRYAPAHEIGHVLIDKNNGIYPFGNQRLYHFNQPGNIPPPFLWEDQNLMSRIVLHDEHVAGNKRLWDEEDLENINQFRQIHQSRFLD
ncbi:MAG: hypothetical protein NUW00_00070, partial [Candidatus Kaiserbacteria bacterium]|nr:hypothetical protein [Candidatus Kaiserbacteria bacterium]